MAERSLKFHCKRFDMASLKAGFSRVDVTPQLGISISGYYVARSAKKILDPLEVNCVAFNDGEKTALVLTVDTLGLENDIIDEARDAIVKATGVESESIFLNSSHTHTGARTTRSLEELRSGSDAEESLELTKFYVKFLISRLADAAVFAIQDMAEASLSIARTHASRISFGRRYLMKDGKIRTNPGVLNPDIVKAVGTADDEVLLLRIDRTEKKSIAVINFQTHPDVVGGENISTDWPGFVRRSFESALDGDVHAIFLNGTQGDVNHVCVDPKPGELNGMINDFDDVYRGYEHAKHMGRLVAGVVMGVWGKCKAVESGKINYKVGSVRVPAQTPKPEELPLAREYVALHKAGRDAEIPFQGMELTTAVADAERKLSLEHGPEFFDLPISSLTIGTSVAFAGFPGEPFNDIGVEVKKNSAFEMTIPSCCTNGYMGYFPFSDAYEQGGYESRSSPFGPSVARDLIDGQVAQLQRLFQ